MTGSAVLCGEGIYPRWVAKQPTHKSFAAISNLSNNKKRGHHDGYLRL